MGAQEVGAGFTCRYTAGLRFVEGTMLPDPVIIDPLAGVLAGERGLELARAELRQLVEAQGHGRHLRVPARSRLIDDILEREIAALRNRYGAQGPAPPPAQGPDGAAGLGPDPTPSSGPGPGPAPDPGGTEPDQQQQQQQQRQRGGAQGGGQSQARVHCQVVSLGAGMCTRPWRLAALAGCAVIELDLPAVAAAKLGLLAGAGAQVAQPPAAAAAPVTLAPSGRHPPDADTNTGTAARDAGVDVVAGADRPAQSPPPPPAPSFPLLAGSYACVGLDLSSCGPAGLGAALRGAGFSPAAPTLWVLEAVLYYMPLGAACRLLAALAGLSGPGSRLVATCVDRELLEACRAGVPKGHVFADLWHFEAEELLYGTEAFAGHWEVDWGASCGGPGELAAPAPKPPPPPPPPPPAPQSSHPQVVPRSQSQSQQEAEGEQRRRLPQEPEPQEPSSAPLTPAAATSPEAGSQAWEWVARPAGRCDVATRADGGNGGEDIGGGSGASGGDSAQRVEAAGEGRRRLPPSTRRLALERLGADTYVALYGGSELLFVAGLRGAAR